MEDHINLKNTGLKVTLPRLKVLSIFENSVDKHLSAEDIYKIILSSGEEVGLATIYRVLTQFEQAGLLIRHHFESGKAVFELNQKTHHDHIVCLQCGFIKEFVDDEIERLQNKVAEKNGFKIIEHSLYIYADCTNKPCNCRSGGLENITKCHGSA
tara:strand:+ start:745 stop:1209 length:465 start_codon:yes stop_codon:yes gene_type:complete